MVELSIQEMIDSGAHFGHQTKRWNPKMKPYIFGVRSGVHIIDLQQTFGLSQNAFNAVEEIVADGGDVLFVGTKPQAQICIEEEAVRCSMPYVSKRWLGGMLTNHTTIRKSVDRMLELEHRRENNDFEGYTKKERLGIDREIEKMNDVLGGIRNLKKLPRAIFVVDPQIEKIAVHEANLSGIVVIAVTDSNCDPDPIDYVIPANDDAIRSIKTFAKGVADACLAGLEKRQVKALADEKERQKNEAKKPKKKTRQAQEVEGTAKAFIGKKDDGFESDEKIESYSASVEKEQPKASTPIGE